MFKSKRTFVNIAIFGSFLILPFLPWYVPFACAIVASWYFSYYEFIFLGFLMDIFFASSHMSLGGQSLLSHEIIVESTLPFVSATPSFLGTFFFTLLTASIVFILQMIKKRVRFYS
jgi:hypothetical protein